MKKKFYGIFKLLVFLFILFICLYSVYSITKRKRSYDQRADFMKQEENFDALFFGSSHMLNAVLPTELWDDYGIVSYNLAQSSEKIPVSYWEMMLALQYTNPNLIVIDAHMAMVDEKYNEDDLPFLHLSLDSYPVSTTKIKAINDIFEEEERLDSVINYTFNFALYHSRWKELTRTDFLLNNNKYPKGTFERINVAVPKTSADFETTKIYSDEETVGMKYLRKMIEHCIDNKIEILVTYMPYPAGENDTSISKYVNKICEEYDVNYINFLGIKENIINENTDYFDSDSHLNPSGAKKITNYLGKYIIENYDIKNQKQNKAYAFWYNDYDEYIEYKKQNLKQNKEKLNNFLMLLYDDDFYYDIKIKSTVNLDENFILSKLLSNLSNNYQIDDSVFKSNNGKDIKIIVYDKRDNSIIQDIYFAI